MSDHKGAAKRETYTDKRDVIAAALANARAMRRGAPPITNVLDLVPARIKDELYDDADCVIAALAGEAT